MQQRSSSCKLFYDKCLGFEDKIGDGFVFCRRFDIPAQRLYRYYNSKKETVKIDLQEDVKLNELLSCAMEKVQEGNSIVQEAQILADLTVDRLGGQACENFDEGFYWSQMSSLQDQNGGVLLGNLSVGQCIHRAILFKFLSDSLGILVRIIQEESGAKVYVQQGNCEYTVHLMDQPGSISKEVQSKVDEGFEVVQSNSGTSSTKKIHQGCPSKKNSVKKFFDRILPKSTKPKDVGTKEIPISFLRSEMNTGNMVRNWFKKGYHQKCWNFGSNCNISKIGKQRILSLDHGVSFRDWSGSSIANTFDQLGEDFFVVDPNFYPELQRNSRIEYFRKLTNFYGQGNSHIAKPSEPKQPFSCKCAIDKDDMSNKKRKYIISTRCIDQDKSQLHDIDPIYDFEQELDDDICLHKLAYLISEKVSQYRGCSDSFYKIYVDEFRMNGFSFGVEYFDNNERLRDYIRVVDDNEEKLNLEAYLVIYQEQTFYLEETLESKISSCSNIQDDFTSVEGNSEDIGLKQLVQRVPFLRFIGDFPIMDKSVEGNFEDESLRQLLPREQAPGFIASIKPGLVIVADCPNCNKKINKPLKLFKNRTGTFNLEKGVSCPQCRSLLSKLDSPCLAECDYNYQGEKSDGQIVDNIEWKTVYKNHVVFWKENEDQTQEIPNWIKLKIFVKIFDTRYCVACQQQFRRDEFQEADCGHRYHPTCYRMVSKGQGYCVAEGCRFALTKKN